MCFTFTVTVQGLHSTTTMTTKFLNMKHIEIEFSELFLDVLVWPVQNISLHGSVHCIMSLTHQWESP